MPIIVNAELVAQFFRRQTKPRRPKRTQAYSRANLAVLGHQHLGQMQLGGGRRVRRWMYAPGTRFQQQASRTSCESLQQRATIHSPLLYRDRRALDRTRKGAPLLLHLDSQLLQLRVADRSWRVHHQVDCAGSFWEGNDFAEAVGSCQDHHDTVEAEGYASVGRRAILESFQEEAEAGAGLVFGHAQRMENLALDVLTVNTDGA